MTNRSAIILALVLALVAGIDAWFGWPASVLFGKKFLLLVETIAIWR